MNDESVARWLADRGAYLVGSEDGEVLLVLSGWETDSYSEAIQQAMSGDPPERGVYLDPTLIGEFLSHAAPALSGPLHHREEGDVKVGDRVVSVVGGQEPGRIARIIQRPVYYYVEWDSGAYSHADREAFQLAALTGEDRPGAR